MSSQQSSFKLDTKKRKPDLLQQTDSGKPVMSSTGTPFEITGFRTEKFEDTDEDSSRVDRCSEDPSVMELFRTFRGDHS